MLEKTTAASIPTCFKEVVDLHGGRVALSTDAIQWTYSELDRLSDAVAHTVAARLGAASAPVALVMDHGAPLIAAVLGVLKAGKIYLVVDPLDPTSRLQSTIAAAGVALVLTDSAYAELAHSVAEGAVPTIELAFDLADSPVSDRPLPTPPSDSGAWLTYTSGSTGVPKGVWQNHEGTIDHARTFARLIGAAPSDRFSLLTSLSLMASTSAMFAALLTGATLCPFGVRSEGVERLAKWLHRQGITVYHSVPTLFRHLMRAADGESSLQSLRLIRLGGEPIRVSDVALYRAHCPDSSRLMLSFSSTESGLITAALIDKRTRLPEGIVPAGFPVEGVELQIVDEQGRALPRGEEGRVAVRSVHVARGYWRQPDATAQAFQPDENNPEMRRFITNDLGRILEDGSLLHLGRADQVVKIRGRRVDLLEVEENLCACELVEEAAAAAAEDPAGDNRLVGYVVLKPALQASIHALRRALAHLPEHLIPTNFVILDRLPQTPGGKLDRRALPRWSPEPTAAAGGGNLPRKGVEQRLATIWERVFGHGPIGRSADFFDLGGTSIQSVRMLALIAERFDVMLPPSVLVEHSTVEALARVIADKRVQPTSDPLLLLRDDHGGRPLFLVHSGEGDLALYGQLARRLSGRPIYGLQSVGLDGERVPIRSVESMARRYLDDLLKQDPTGPYLIGGTRMGGKVALEMAGQLLARGRPVQLLALFDFYPPRRRRYYDFFVNPVRQGRDWIRIWLWAAFRLARRNNKNLWLSDYRGFVASMNCAARHDYRMKRYPGTITLFLTSDRIGKEHEALRHYTREVRTILVPGTRDGLLKPPAVDIVARELQAAMAESEIRRSA